MSPVRLNRNRSIAPLIALSTLALFGCSEESATPLAPRIDAPQFSVAQTGLTSTGWQERARQLVTANTLSPMAAGRAYALLAVAQYAALTDADAQSNDGTLPGDGYGEGGRARFESERGAVAGASAVVLSFLFPSAAASLQQRVVDEGNAGPGGTHPQYQSGVEIGSARGARIVARARADHFTDVWTGTVPTGPGMWINNGPPLLPLLGTVTPFVMTSGNQFRSPPPPAFGSATFLTDLNEIRTLSATRTPQQLATAIFWNMPPGTPTPLGYWNQLAASYINENRLNERAATHILAVLNAAMFDALIGCWDAKYYYWTIRPSQAASDITLPIGLPNHPSYPSGHSCGSSAAVTVLGHYFPSHATELNAQMVEAGLSRMYAGIHYRFDITGGQNLGRAVAQHALSVDQSRGILSNIQ